jgi:hypothetical protein
MAFHACHRGLRAEPEGAICSGSLAGAGAGAAAMSLARLADLEQRYDGPIPWGLRRAALSDPCAPARQVFSSSPQRPLTAPGRRPGSKP